MPGPTLDPIEREAVAEVEAVKRPEPVADAVPPGRKGKAIPESAAKVEKRSTSLYLTGPL